MKRKESPPSKTIISPSSIILSSRGGSKYSNTPQNIFDPTSLMTVSPAPANPWGSSAFSPFNGNRKRYQWLSQYLVSFRGSLTSLFTSIFPWKSFAYIKAIKARRNPDGSVKKITCLVRFLSGFSYTARRDL